MHGGYLNPHGWFDLVHVKVIGSASRPELGVLTIELRKIKLREAAQLVRMEGVGGDGGIGGGV